jgi:hypothetical protein
MYQAEKLPIEKRTNWWTCHPTSENGRCGVPNSCGIDIHKFVMMIKGNLASGSNHRGGPIE